MNKRSHNIDTEDVYSIDDRIRSIYFENAESPEDLYYIKLWFNYKTSRRDKVSLGHHEFYSLYIEDLYNQIKEFFETKHNGWEIF